MPLPPWGIGLLVSANLGKDCILFGQDWPIILDRHIHRAAVLEINPATGSSRVFASGLRNPVGLGWKPQSGALWAVVNERDELGSLWETARSDELVFADFFATGTTGSIFLSGVVLTPRERSRSSPED
jgi:hypothetical protein